MIEGPARRETLIPMVGAAGGAVARVAADSELPPQHQAQLDRELSDLLECGLYQAGQQAKAAVRSLKLSGGGLLGRSAAALSVVNPGDVTGLGTENSSSAELGLAIALLLFHSRANERSVLASGALNLNAGASQVQIGAVHHLGEKLRLVAEYFRQPGSAKPPKWFLIPPRDPDGSDVTERYGQEIESLDQLGMTVRPVATLSEAAKILGASRIALRNSERRLRRMVAAAAVAAAAAAAGSMWLNSAVPLRFTTIAAPDGNVLMTPARVIRQGSAAIVPPCRQAAGTLPTFEIGNQIAVRVRTDPAPFDVAPWVGGYHYVVVAVSALSLPKVMPAAGASTHLGTEFALDILGPPEETTLTVLARRGTGFDTDKLRANLIHLLIPLKRVEWDSAARRYLHEAAPGVLSFRFLSVQPGSCS
jgi:hypothetical protein